MLNNIQYNKVIVIIIIAEIIHIKTKIVLSFFIKLITFNFPNLSVFFTVISVIFIYNRIFILRTLF